MVDFEALVKYVAANPQWLNLLDPNKPALNALARSQRAGMNLPGVQAVTETIRSVKGGAQ